MTAPKTDYLFRSLYLRGAALPLSWLYRAGLALRPAGTPARVNRPVVSIGNIHAGGSGKTPLVKAVAERLAAARLKVAVVSRGYGGRASRSGIAVASETKSLLAGDEPVELARALPHAAVFIGADRVRAAWEASKSADVILLDDGFQHRRLARDLDIVVIPATSHPARERLLPLGRLREPPAALARAHAIVFLREENEPLDPAIPAAWAPFHRAQVFEAVRVLAGVRPYKGTVEPIALLSRPVVAFSGIARPERFHAAIARAGGRIVDAVSRPDHHRFSRADLAIVARLVERHHAVAVTTAKDAARLDEQPLAFPAAVLEIGVQCDDLCRLLVERLAGQP